RRVRQAGARRRPGWRGPWLAAAAYRTAVRARAHAVRRRARESRVEDLPAPAPADDLLWPDLRPVLDEAIGGPPSKYRTPFVLCHPAVLTIAQAAQHLGLPPGTEAA